MLKLTKRKRPNFLLLFPDQHRGDWLPFDETIYAEKSMQKLPIRMPNLKKIMDNGVTFKNAITSSPLCAPARACLASGLRYDKCGTPSNDENYPLDKKTFYSVLKDNNYSVGGVGKFDLHKPTHWWGLDGWVDDLGILGFTDGIDNAGKIDAIVSGEKEPKDPYMKYLYDNGLEKIHLNDMTNRKHGTNATELTEEAYCDNWVSNNAINMIEGFSDNKPWFIQVNFTGPHNPWDVTKRMRQAWEGVDFPYPNGWENKSSDINIMDIRRNYAAMLENIDRNIALIIDEIIRRGELENTIIIYASDHGEMLGDFCKFGKCHPYRGSINIPLVISGPGIKKGIYCDELVELQDLTATITEYSGAIMKEATDSISLKPILEGGNIKHREYQVSELNWEGKGIRWKSISDGRHKLIINKENEYELYDLVNDPWENNNIAPQNEEIMKKIRLSSLKY